MQPYCVVWIRGVGIGPLANPRLFAPKHFTTADEAKEAYLAWCRSLRRPFSVVGHGTFRVARLNVAGLIQACVSLDCDVAEADAFAHAMS